MNATQSLPGMLRRYLPILTWGPQYSRRTFDALTAASTLSKRAGKDVMEGAS